MERITGSTPLALQDEMAAVIEERTQELYFEGQDGDRLPLHVFKQDLPPETDDNRAQPFPYVVIRINDGSSPRDGRDVETIRTLILIGVRSEGTENRAHRDVLGIMQRIKEIFTRENGAVAHFALDAPIEWALDDAETFPYAFGGMDMTWRAQPIRREDPLT